MKTRHIGRRAVFGGSAVLIAAACAEASGLGSTAWALEPAPSAPSSPSGSAPADSTAAPKDEVIQGGEDDANRLTAPVMINGQGPFAFIVDTGAQRSVLADDLVARLSLEPGEPIRVHGVAGVVTTASAKVATFQVGSRELEKLNLPLLSRHDIGADGVLGIDALQGQTVLLDFRQRQIIVHASVAERHLPDEVVVHAKSRFGQLILVDSSFDSETVLVVVDTGAESSIANLSLQRLIERRREHSVGATSILSVTGQKTTGDWQVTPQLQVGGININNLPVIFSDLHNFKIWRLDDQPSMLLGMDVLRQFDTVQIDFLRREVRFRVPRPGEAPLSRTG